MIGLWVTAILPGLAFAGNPRDLPLLAPGKHLGTLVTFEGIPSHIENQAASRWQEAVSRGMSIGRVHTDWDALERRGPYSPNTGLKASLVRFKQSGIQPLVTICTIDKYSLSLPPDLLEPGCTDRLANGLHFDDPAILERFLALLDWLVPMLTQHGGWALSVANAADGYLAAHAEEVPHFLRFLSTVRQHCRRLSPDLAVTVSMSEGALRGEHGPTPPWFAELIAECDVACFDYTPLDPDTLLAPDLALIPKHVDGMMAAAAGRQVVLEDMYFPAGYENGGSSINSSPRTQREAYKTIIGELAARPGFRAAYTLQIIDWSPGLAGGMLMAELDRQHPTELYRKRYEEIHRTYAMCRYEDASPRPAWFAFLDGVEQLARERTANKQRKK